MVAVNPTGIVILIAGVWVTCQILGGNALERLNILKQVQDPSKGEGYIRKLPEPKGQSLGGSLGQYANGVTYL